jgi:hypothetical protein
VWPLLALSLIATPPVGYTDAASVGVSMSGTIYVVDVGANELMVGERRTRIGSFGRPTDVDASNELTVVVADPDGRRIVTLDRHLQPLGELISDTDRFDRIAVNRYRELFALDTRGRTLRKFRANGELDASFTPPSLRGSEVTDVAVHGDHVLVAQGDVLLILDRFGLETGFRRLPSVIRRVAGTTVGAVVLAGEGVYILDATWKTVSQVSIPEGCVDIALHDGRLYLLFPHTLTQKALH